MFHNYLTVAVRNLLKHRLYSAINIFGLAVGLASCILILLFVRHELSYDQAFANADRIYRVHTRFDLPGRSPIIGVTSPGPALAALEKDFSEIETGVRFRNQSPVLKRRGDVFTEDFVIADPTFLEVFDLPLTAGKREGALSDAASVLISESMARKYFGDKPAVGQVLDATFGFGQRDLHVTGVFKDLPSNTHLKFDFISRLNESDFEKMPWMFKSWTSINTWTYLKLKPGADVNAISRALPEFESRNVPNVPFGGQDFKTADFMQLSLMPLRDLHLHSKGIAQMKPVGDFKTVATFSVVAVMILVIACINFTNLATARASQRAREVALRKVVGAKRRQLVIQFLGESVLMATLALILALAIVHLALPGYNTILQKQLTLSYFGPDGLALEMLGFILIVGVAAGVYPALYLSGFLPSRILKANKSAAAEGSGHLRTGLVIVQFAISIGLLICTAVVYGQTLYARTMDLGYSREGLMVVRTASDDQAHQILDTLKREAVRLPGIKAATVSGDVPTDGDENNTTVEIPGKPSPEPILLQEKAVDYDFFSTYRIPLLAGRYLDENHGEDDFPKALADKIARGTNVVVNQRAIARLGFGSPQEAVGQQLRIGVGNTNDDKDVATITIVGVVGDFYYRSVRDELAPTIFLRGAEGFRSLTIRYEGIAPSAVRDAVGKVWRDLAPATPYKAEFLDALVNAQYQAEDAEAALFGAFSGLAIVVACLGLYGLASFSAERRTKEIGVRKVLGARVRDIVRLLVWDFSKPVLIANALAWPVAWLLMRDWLNGFQNRIDLSPALFVAAGAVALVIAWLTIAGQAARVGRANPIHALRYE